MARKKISEFRAKTLLSAAVGQTYRGFEVDAAQERPAALDRQRSYAVKVDQGVKGRQKQGLVALGRTPDQVYGDISRWHDQGFRYFLVEPFIAYPPDAECYLSIERTREGSLLRYSQRGGVEVERHRSAVQRRLAAGAADLAAAESTLGLPSGWLEPVLKTFDRCYISMLEINPLVVADGQVEVLDLAVEVDDAAGLMAGGVWSPADFRYPRTDAPEEFEVRQLAAGSRASFSLEVLNRDGAVFLLLSGGGGSLVVADEVYSRGFGRKLANYGEYSGNPTEPETYRYAKQVLSLLLRSAAPQKVLIIGGGVANFTDVSVTFRGIIQALEDEAGRLRQQRVKVFVRRGGPGAATGLRQMRDALARQDLLGLVAGPELSLGEVVSEALGGLKRA
ncbi:hypothetical protein KY386_00250 [Candidatus Parcubacteria bacterium]|nr:hypothetical protein [Candidatus Parcubacteria bacterium]